MEYEKVGVCPICDTEFVKTRTGRKYCSHRCANLYANRAKNARAKGIALENGTDCPYNKALICSKQNCDSCGWNPAVEKRRRKNLGKR